MKLHDKVSNEERRQGVKIDTTIVDTVEEKRYDSTATYDMSDAIW